MKTYTFEKLDVWQRSRTLALVVYKATKLFPDDEKFGLISQMRRSSISVSSNLAEGNSKYSGKEKARFTEMAYGSLMELLNQSIISHDLGFLQDELLKEMREMIDEISLMATRLRDSQLKMKWNVIKSFLFSFHLK